MNKFIDSASIEAFPFDAFKRKYPYPWFDFKGFLRPEAFLQLSKEFPSLELFEYHENIYRKDQRPHNRYYLAYERSIYHKNKEKSPGTVTAEELSPAWRDFIAEIMDWEPYKSFILKALDIQDYTPRFAWHIGRASNEVSPHLDTSSKQGTHIFYFNRSDEWDPTWGGNLLILGGAAVQKNNPEYVDFTVSLPVSNVDNHSFLFKNTEKAWHGVKPLQCPEGKYRKLFNVIFEKKHQ